MQPLPTLIDMPDQPTPGPSVGMPPGAVRMTKRYYDRQGRMQLSRRPVPIDQYGVIAGVEFECRRCVVSRWYPANLKGVPTCEGCDRRMVPVPLRRPPLLPWRELWDVCERPLRPVWALPALAAAGYAVDAAHIPLVAVAGAAPVVGELARRFAHRQQIRANVARGRLEEDDPGGGKRLRQAIARRSRAVGYTTAGAMGWLALAAGLGVDPHTLTGKISLTALGLMWLLPATTWWRKVRRETWRSEPLPEPVQPLPEVVDYGSLSDPEEDHVRDVWARVIAAKKGTVIDRRPDGTPVVATRNGKLAETWLEDWRRVEGGWAATAVSPSGMYVGENFIAARGAVASAFRMKASMITCIPDPDDETRALYLAQRSSPIVDTVRWSGPESIDVQRGVAPVARYIDGAPVLYELYRPGWGVPHVAAFGTTGSGKSEFINQLFTIDRWAHYVDEQGAKRGIVADFLIDPQQGQSFAPFLDDLAAPVATSIEEAMMLVEALTAEMLRRNRYLAREAKTWDAKRKKWRTGRKWWNPLVDGPILALTIDEAHDYLSHKPFAALVTKAGRMWRKCGGQLRIATHTPLLSDLGGSMALRDMLTGGFVFMGRTANSLSGPTAFNGRLPVDPRTIPAVPGMAYILTGLEPKPMLARAMFEPDYYDWVRDVDDQPIGYPGVLPQVTLDAFGRDYQQWAAACAGGDVWTPGETAQKRTSPVSDGRCRDAVLLVLARAMQPLGMDDLDRQLHSHGIEFSTMAIREALAALRKADPPLVDTVDGRHQLTQRGLEEALTRKELLSA